jgi:LytTr DNA-binding domain
MFTPTKFERNKLIFSLMVLSAWTAFGLFFGTQNYVRDVYTGKGASLPGYLAGWLVCGYSWAILTVPVLRFARRFSLDRLGWLRVFLVHLPLAVVFASAQLGLYVVIAGSLFGTSGHGLWEFYKFIFVQEFQSSFLVYFAIVSAVTAYDRFFNTAPKTDTGPDIGRDTASADSLNGNAKGFLRRIPVKENGRILLVDAQDVDWVESYGNYVFLHTRERRHIFRETMAAMEKNLDPQNFVRIRRSAIVKIDQIKEFSPTINGEFEIVLKNGQSLSSSRRYRKNLENIVKR